MEAVAPSVEGAEEQVGQGGDGGVIADLHAVVVAVVLARQKAQDAQGKDAEVEGAVVDDVEVGEIGMLQQLIASYGVPVGVITGDLAASFEINTFSTK